MKAKKRKKRVGKKQAKIAKKLKIGFFCDAYEPIMNGVTISMNSFKKGLEKKGHKVFVVAPKYPKHRDKGSSVIRIPSLTLFSKSKYRLAMPSKQKITKIISKLDVIHIHHPGPIGWIASAAAKEQGKPYLFTHHTMYEDYWHYFPLPKKPGKKFINYAIATFCSRFKFIILPSESVMKRFYKRKLKEKIETAAIPTGIDISSFKRTNKSRIRRKYRIGKDEIVLMFLGRIAKEKNTGFLIRSFRKIIHSNKTSAKAKGRAKKIKLLLVGGGPELQSFKEIVEKRGLQDSVIFTDFVKHSEIPDYFAASDIFVFPSKTETQGLVSLEAMAAGIPVIGLDATGTRDAVVNNKTGFLCRNNIDEFARKTKKLINDKKLRKRFSKNSIAESKKYSIEETTKKLLAFYNKIITYYTKRE